MLNVERETRLYPWNGKTQVKRAEVPMGEGWRLARKELETMCQDVEEINLLSVLRVIWTPPLFQDRQIKVQTNIHF